MAFFNLCAGHGAEDSGAVGPNRRLEKDDNLRISLAVGEELIKRGHTVRQLRGDDSINNSAAVCRNWLEQYPADFSVVFHRNAYNGSANGVEVWSFNADTFSCDVAKEMSKAIAEAGGFYNRGKKGNGAAWLSPNVPCIEPEIGFIDCEGDNVKFDQTFSQIVKAICDVLEKFFGKVVKTPTYQKEYEEAVAKIEELNAIIETQTKEIDKLNEKINAIQAIVEQ